MATRKARTVFAIKRFKGFWNQFKQSKRGVLGIAIIIFWVLVAIAAPLLTPYAPIDPQLNRGDYPKYPPNGGPKIASELSVPSWYKYLPWIYRGPIEKTETFVNNVTITSHGEKFSSLETNLLSTRVARIIKVQVTFNNGSSRVLKPNTEWSWSLKNTRILNIPRDYASSLPNGAVLSVTYLTGVDLTENLEVVSDHNFASNETFIKEWNWTSSTDSVKVKYNNEKGYKNDGCVEISYNPKVNETKANAILLNPFNYPYWEPPKSFQILFSVHVVGEKNANVGISLLLFKENETKPSFLYTNFTEPVASAYDSERVMSTTNETKASVGSLLPEETLFPDPANYTFAIEFSFPKKENVTVYLDNTNFILYGNSFGLLGTDNRRPYPEDQFTLLVYGSRVSLIVGILAAVFSTLIGLFLGLAAGYIGGIFDEFVMRVADLFLVLPTLPLFIVLIAVLKSTYGLVSMWNIIIVLTLFGWMGFARTVRSMAISIRERPFVEAAKAAGAGKFYIINRHIVPNVFALVYITLATSVPGAIITEASLSWLGLGDPYIPSWGKILYDFNTSGIAVTKGLTDYWFWIFPPCISIAILATAFILVGFALDEILNPKLRKRR